MRGAYYLTDIYYSGHVITLDKLDDNVEMMMEVL